jgi:hypothetical protein
VEDADFKKLIQCRIIRAGVLDPQGKGWKVRPLVVLTPPASNDPDAEFRVVAGSTQSPVAGNEETLQLKSQATVNPTVILAPVYPKRLGSTHSGSARSKLATSSGSANSCLSISSRNSSRKSRMRANSS